MAATGAAPVGDDRELRGIAGYESPYPYLEKLQEKMEERLDRKVPVKGRFCGFCYARLREADAACPYCANTVAACPTVDEVPQDVLRAYLLRRKIEARWVHLGAFFGLILASILFVVLVIWGPGILGHPALAFTVLILGGYLLAQLFGPLVGGQIGYRKGSIARDVAWAAHLGARDSVETE